LYLSISRASATRIRIAASSAYSGGATQGLVRFHGMPLPIEAWSYKGARGESRGLLVESSRLDSGGSAFLSAIAAQRVMDDPQQGRRLVPAGADTGVKLTLSHQLDRIIDAIVDDSEILSGNLDGEKIRILFLDLHIIFLLANQNISGLSLA
jgi:hypothetical protein